MFSRHGVQAGNVEAQREVQALLDVPRKLQLCVCEDSSRCSVYACTDTGIGMEESSGVVERLQQRRRERYVRPYASTTHCTQSGVML